MIKNLNGRPLMKNAKRLAIGIDAGWLALVQSMRERACRASAGKDKTENKQTPNADL